MSEALITEIRNKIVEIKDTINKMRNTYDGMNSEMEKAEEGINDLRKEGR